MLRHLHIRNYILIDSLDVTFPEGLVIITGQTGAGKSILLGALGLLAGEKADASLISEGAETCVVEGEFSTPEGERIIRRVLYSSGRSRSFIDDCPVQLQELAELSARLFDIHSQHQSLLLTDRRFQLDLLDRRCGSSDALQKCHGVWKRLGEARAELSRVSASLEKARAESSYNSSALQELEAAALREGELENLEEEQLALGNAEEILERLATATGSLEGEQYSVRDSLLLARKSLEHAARFVPSMEPLAQRLDAAAIEIDDITSDIAAAAERIEASPERLAAVEQRLSLLYRLMGKHGCKSIEDLIAVRERLSAEVSGSDELEERESELRGLCSRLEAEHRECCDELHALRSSGTASFSEEVTRSLRYLELERATFGVQLESAAPGPDGADSVCFTFSADGTRNTPLEKCASGGELSRIMLSLKALMSQFKGMPTLIFDEIDTGVSGSVAAKMGQMICDMGRRMQVFSITHLPQVAAKGSAHYVVSKTFNEADGRTRSGIALVEGEDRVREIARLLSGESISEEALANARVLMGV